MVLQDQDVAEYRSLSGMAVGSLVLGLLSPVALVDPLAWCIPFAGVLISLYAIFHIRRNAESLTGRKAALWGLCLSLCFAAAAPADRMYYRYRIREEAKPFAAIWFQLLAENRPEMAYQLTLIAKDRQPLDNGLWDYYVNNPLVRAGLDRFVAPAKDGENPQPVRTLLALGKSATVRYLDAPLQNQDEGVDILRLRYAVTYDDAGEKKTFILFLELLRMKGGEAPAYWKINGCGGTENKPKEI
jgi:hypothetical protein